MSFLRPIPKAFLQEVVLSPGVCRKRCVVCARVHQIYANGHAPADDLIIVRGHRRLSAVAAGLGVLMCARYAAAGRRVMATTRAMRPNRSDRPHKRRTQLTGSPRSGTKTPPIASHARCSSPERTYGSPQSKRTSHMRHGRPCPLAESDLLGRAQQNGRGLPANLPMWSSSAEPKRRMEQKQPWAQRLCHCVQVRSSVTTRRA